MLAQLTATNAFSRRGDRLWRLLATTSLPVPDSPLMETDALEGATFSMSSKTLRITGAWPMKSVPPSCLSRLRSPCTSRSVSRRSSAREMQTFSLAVSRGFSMKS